MPGFDDRVWQTGAIITGQTQRRLCCRLRFQRVTLLCQASGSRQRKSRRVWTPDLSQRLSSKSMAIPETPILRTVLHPSSYQALLKNGGGQVLGRHWSASTLPRHLRHLAPVHLRNVRAYILFDCPRGIFADNHKKYLHDCILIVTFVETDFYEMRVSVGNNEYRTVLFAVDNENIILSTRIYVLNAFKKKSKQDYKK